MLLDALRSDGLKRAVTDVERDGDHLDPGCRERLDEAGSEMQSRGRRGDRSARPREHRLITLAILDAIVAPDVRRQRDMADRVDRGVERRAVVGREVDDAPSEKSPFEDL